MLELLYLFSIFCKNESNNNNNNNNTYVFKNLEGKQMEQFKKHEMTNYLEKSTLIQQF